MPYKFKQVILFWISLLPRGDLHEARSSQLYQNIVPWPDVWSAQTHPALSRGHYLDIEINSLSLSTWRCVVIRMENW